MKIRKCDEIARLVGIKLYKQRVRTLKIIHKILAWTRNENLPDGCAAFPAKKNGWWDADEVVHWCRNEMGLEIPSQKEKPKKRKYCKKLKIKRFKCCDICGSVFLPIKFNKVCSDNCFNDYNKIRRVRYDKSRIDSISDGYVALSFRMPVKAMPKKLISTVRVKIKLLRMINETNKTTQNPLWQNQKTSQNFATN